MPLPAPFRRCLPALVALGLAAAPLWGGLCKACRGLSHTKDIGSCKLCEGMTTSGAFQLCMTCSERLQGCERCRADLPPGAPPLPERGSGTFAFGRWTYTLRVSNAGTKSEGYHGALSFAGQPLPEPAAINDVVHTPWGALHWVGQPVTLFGGHGWMPTPKPSAPVGQRVSPPAPNPKATLEVRLLSAGRGTPSTEDWIRRELAALGAPAEVGAISGWEALGSEPVTLHDSRHYGQAVLSWRDPGGEAPLRVEISGSQMQAFDLPRAAGTQRVVKHTLASSIATMDLFLAFRVGAGK